ncbi:Rieske domain-containing protein [Exophiala viscosa]|uniref:Choline monooxygenase, chloroplastic n=1 Tax=Exophiala viscosa TaxID=2486360 RepID=A0AAN6DSF4_9EURO|nr:Rieske domain-containing protein [Exophiala viscosa]KAI1628745.1 Rieske domain-containing protein [Exophiala viscosa]
MSDVHLNGNTLVAGVHENHVRGLSTKAISTDLNSTLPAEFYHSQAIYQLERRAIFSTRWFLVSHKARYRDVGDFVQYEMAGFNFVVVKNKEGSIIGFHNVCRHRAFPVVQETSGKARIFSCKYHGWSYDLTGKLTKAPRFTLESVPSFDPSTIRLFPIHIHVDTNGFVYVNLDASPKPKISWEAQYGQLDRQERLANSGIDWDAIEYDFTWAKDGGFNWKVMQDNYNECYHCLTAHPDVAETTDLNTYYVSPGDGYIAHFNEPKPSILANSAFDEKRFAGRSQTHVFPGGHFSPNPGTGFMHLMRSIPTSATTTRQEYDVYRLNTPHATPEAHERMTNFYRKVVDEDFELCEKVQKNLERGIFEMGLLHPFHEEGVHAFQGMVLKALREQIQAEEKAGTELWAAKPKNLSSAKNGRPEEAVDEQKGGRNVCETMLGCQTLRLRSVDW